MNTFCRAVCCIYCMFLVECEVSCKQQQRESKWNAQPQTFEADAHSIEPISFSDHDTNFLTLTL